MNFFEKSKILTIAIIGLLILNFATLAFLFFHKPPAPFPFEPPRQEARGFFQKELNLTDQQRTEFANLREEHSRLVMQIQDSIRSLKDKMFEQLKNDKIDSASVINSASLISENQKRLELATFYHFAKMRSLLTDEQKAKFDNVMQDMMRMVGPNPPKGPFMRQPGNPPMPPR